MRSEGSLWRKWDLHVHTPFSYHWKGQHLKGQSQQEIDSICKLIIDQMNSIDVIAFGIMDYWTFEGYFAIRDYLRRNPSATDKSVFPGVELRLEAPTNHRLNTHVLFDLSTSNESLNTFLSRLHVAAVSGKPPTRDTFIELGRSYDDGKLSHHGFAGSRSDDDRMCLLGKQTAVVTKESLRDAIDTIGKQHSLIVQPYDTNDGLEDLDWKRHPYDDSYLMKMADMFETRDEIHVNLFLGFGHPKKQNVGTEFIHNLGGTPKPVVSGSDAHTIPDYGVYPSGRATWLKAQPTFAGLRQVCCEPPRRCFIGPTPPKITHVTNNPTKYIARLQIDKLDESRLDERWFEGVDLELNPGLIAIIGNKGGGKSALTDILATAGNTHRSEMEFLNDKRFRRLENKAKHFQATLTWRDGASNQITLDQNPNRSTPERIRYIPQQVIESLCNEISGGSETEFEREIKRVIFFHLPEDSRLNKANLDELLVYLGGGHQTALAQSQATIQSLNTKIVSLEREIREEAVSSYCAALALKQTELAAHDKTRPEEVSQPTDEQTSPDAKTLAENLSSALREMQEITSRLESARAERGRLTARRALLDRLLGRITVLENHYSSFVEEISTEFLQADVRLADILTLSVDKSPIFLAAKAATDGADAIEAMINGTAGNAGLHLASEQSHMEIDKLKAKLDAPQKQYQEYLLELGSWQSRRAVIIGSPDKPDTIEFYQQRIQDATDILPGRLETLKDQRLLHVRALHGELLQIRQIYQELCDPVQKLAASNSLVNDTLRLQLHVFFAMPNFAVGFFELVNRNKRGNFYGEEASVKLLNDLVERSDFHSTDGVIGFLDEMMTSLTVCEGDGGGDPLTIESQLKKNRKPEELYNYLFCLKYLEPRYTLKLGEKDIAQLSPGEKGALLLVFHILLDREEIPIIVDQPEHNLDNETVVKLLVNCIREAAERRQVIIVTHNPNLAVVCDADQIICTSIDISDGNKFTFISGAIEDFEMNAKTVNVLEGSYPAFHNRRLKYHEPDTVVQA